MHFDKELDARGLNCPLPILRTKKALTDLPSGQVLKARDAFGHFASSSAFSIDSHSVLSTLMRA